MNAASCPADHEALKSLPEAEWIAHTVALPRRGGPDMPGTEMRNCSCCASTLTRVHDRAALDAYIDAACAKKVAA
jgi:hypothetical protein